MHSNRRPPEVRHVTSQGNGDRCGILGDYPVDMSPARCPPLRRLPPPPPPPPPFSPSASPVFPEDRAFDFRLRSTIPGPSFLESSSRRNNMAASDWRGSQSYRVTESRCSPDYSGTDNEKRLPDEREKEVSYFSYNDISNVPRSMRQNATPPPPPFRRPSSVGSYLLPLASVTPHFVEASSRQAIGGEDGFQVSSVVCASVENYGENRRQQITCSQKTDRKPAFPAEQWFRSRDTTDETRAVNDEFVDCGGEFGVSSGRSRRVLLPTPRVLHPAADHSPASSSSSSQVSFRRPTSTLTSHITSLYMTSSGTLSAESIASNANPNANTTEYSRDGASDGRTPTDQNAPLLRTQWPRRHRPPAAAQFQQQQQQQQQQHYSDAPTAEGHSERCSSSSSAVDEINVSSTEVYVCHICRVRCSTLQNFDVHMSSEDHCRLMKTVARLHFKRTQQKLKSLKVNLKVNRKRRKFTSQGIDSNRKIDFGFKRKGAARAKAATIDSAKPRNSGSQGKTTSRTQKRSCLTTTTTSSNKAKFLFECTFQNEDNDKSTVRTTSKKSNKPLHVLPKGQECVVAVSGFLCKLCNKFYDNENSAKIIHCISRKHLFKYQEMLRMMKTFRETTEFEASKTSIDPFL